MEGLLSSLKKKKKKQRYILIIKHLMDNFNKESFHSQEQESW